MIRQLTLVITLFAVISHCSRETPSDPIGVLSFRHVIIDPQPNAGADCCTDICAIGDIDGDGFMDVVIGAQGSARNELVWYEYPLWRKHAIASGEFTTDGQALDFDGDGDCDVVISDYDRGILWYENPEDSTVGWQEHFIGKDYGHDLEAGDLEGDGDVDVVICNKSQVILWQRQNAGAWQRRVVLAQDGEGTALADLDRDGDLDIIYGASWLETPDNLNNSSWARRVIDGEWPALTRARVADLNGDQRLDVVLSVSEASGQVAWFEAPVQPRTGAWQKHVIESELLQYAHSLQITDLDRDGRADVITAEMHTSQRKRVIAYFNKSDDWLRQIIATTGSHNLRVGDLGNDGDFDLIGKNYAGAGKVIEMWENQLY